ncbi:kelch-like protein 23 [Spea bombifrons]|uniref:kelch-like protein 23 n=1 Tax=Spea bombifrons TaxID=233779 RepID=UPI00234A2078|nr:kelch-like protein 23 [Spea bombifrons]
MATLNDVILEVGYRWFHVDRSVLAAHSRYFEVLFNGGFKESTQHQIHLEGVDKDCFQILLDFINKGTLAINTWNVTAILETADYLDLQQAKGLCVGFLAHELRVSNCLGMMSYALQYTCPELFDSALNVALTHLSDLIYYHEDEFNQLDKETLVRLLQTDDLFVCNEDVVFEAVMKWVMVDTTREKDFTELIALVRPTFLSLSFLDALVKRSQWSERQDTYTRLLKTLNTNQPKAWNYMKENMTTSRTYDTLYVLGGKHEKDQQDLYVYLPKTSTWRTCSPLLRKNLTQYAVATVGHLVIVTGGYFRGDFVWYSIDWVLIYDSLQNSWVDGPPMKISRNCHCAVGIGDHLYAIGGSTDESVTADVERLDLAKMKWESCSPLVRAVERAAAASACIHLYVLCGRDENGDVYSGMQRLNTETDEWSVITYSPMPRYDLCATVLNGVIYTIGGQALRFDLNTEEWSVLDEECLNRKFFMGCGSVNGRIYLLGQRRASITQDIPSFVLFDPYLDICQVKDANIPCPLPIRGCVTMRHYDVWP